MQTTALMQTTAVSQMFILQSAVLILLCFTHVSMTYHQILLNYTLNQMLIFYDSASFEVLPMSHVSEDEKQKVAAPKPKLCSKLKRKLGMIDEDKDGVRVKILPSPRAQFRRKMQQTSILGDDVFIPNRAQLMLDFLKKHGDRIVKEKPGPKKRFPSTLKLVQYVLKQK